MLNCYRIYEVTVNKAHQLPHHERKCKNLHGHTYTIYISILSKIDSNLEPLENIIEEFIEKVSSDLQYFTVSTEILLEKLEHYLEKKIAEKKIDDIKISKIEIFETPVTCFGIEYF